MPSNIWRADHGYCPIPRSHIFATPSPVPMAFPFPMPGTPMFNPCPPGTVPVATAPTFCVPKPKKKKKSKKSKSPPRHCFPMPSLPFFAGVPGPLPFPPPYACAHGDSGDSEEDDSDGYKEVRYSGDKIRLHILKQYTDPDDICDGNQHLWPAERNNTFRKRCYQDNMPIKQFVQDFVGKSGKGHWIVTRVHEDGNGRWRKGSSFDTSGDSGKKTMAEVGWRSDMGPVWVTIEYVAKD